MTRILTPAQVAGIAAQGTPAGTTVAEWVAKADQESRYDAEADNGIAAGLWQINYRANHDLIGSGSIEDARSEMKSPLRNWYVARQVYARQGWQAWAASGGRPRPNATHLAAATAPDFSVANSGGAVGGKPEESVKPVSVLDPLDAVTGGAISALRDAITVLGAAAAWVANPNNWTRIAIVILGGGLALAGLSIFARPVIDEATKVGKAIPL